MYLAALVLSLICSVIASRRKIGTPRGTLLLALAATLLADAAFLVGSSHLVALFVGRAFPVSGSDWPRVRPRVSPSRTSESERAPWLPPAQSSGHLEQPRVVGSSTRSCLHRSCSAICSTAPPSSSSASP